MKILIKILIFGVIWLEWHTGLHAQQLPLYSQYMMNRFLINPAVAGSEGYTSVNITAREQWLGMKNAPKTHAISAQTRVLKNSFISRHMSIRKDAKKSSRSGRVGLGAYVFNDQTGIVNRTGLQLTYAYHIKMKEGQLSFGLSGTGFQFSIDENRLRLYEPGDELIENAQKTMFIPDANTGVYYSNPKLYAGLSVAQLFQSSLKFSERGYESYRLLRHYYLTGGINFDVGYNMMIEPSLLVKTSQNWNFQADINTRLYFRDEYWAGLSYRTGGAIIVMAGVKVDKFYFGYAFDYTLSSIMKHSFGSHEIMIAVKFGDSARRYRWLIRY